MTINENRQSVKLDNSADLPPAVKRSLGIGRFKAKVFQRPGGELIAKAIQEIGEVIIKLTYISGSDKAKSVELTEMELRRVLLMAKDVRKMTGRPTEEECNQAWLEEE
ncbi:MAG: hypothetical protein E3J60_00695 [Dehalococcoidia bacterium]|nr:MAG: hypothetical protein E3J60_00695 [Dehalococcoidia bacterium]